MPSGKGVIIKDREILGGVPVFRGTRVPVQTRFDYLEGGESLEESLAGFLAFPAKWPLQPWKKQENCYPPEYK